MPAWTGASRGGPEYSNRTQSRASIHTVGGLVRGVQAQAECGGCPCSSVRVASA